MEALLATVAPLVVPLDPDCTSVEGFISASGPSCAAQLNSLWVRVTGIPAGAPTLAGARLEVNQELASLLRGCEDVIATRLRESTSLASFFVELRNIVAQLGLRDGSPGGSSGLGRTFFSSLASELEAVGWKHVAHLADDLSTLTLLTDDRRGRRHALRLALPAGYPTAPPTPTADLPLAFHPRWGPGSQMADLLLQFSAALEQHQDLWDSLDDLGDHAWVVEPAAPRRNVTHRRLALGNHVTVVVSLDPLRPGAVPDCKFMGPDREVDPLVARLAANRALWRPEISLRQNLEAVLQVALPSRAAADAGGAAAAEDVSADCAICYAYRLPAAGACAEAGEGAGVEGEAGDVPDINCDTTACGKPFHRRCLAEWLAADTSTRQSFGTLFGACPYCSAPISVKV